MFVKSDEKNVSVKNFGDINLDITLDCGQAFRWQKNPDGSWTGVVKGIEACVSKTDEGLLFKGITEEQFGDIFFDYFDMGRDYSSVLEILCEDERLKKAVDCYGTIRILRQEPWEALCSFIFSACNNIPRIKGIIQRFCENFGEKTGTMYSFPSPERIAELSERDMEILRAGFRSPYILNAARAVTAGEIDLNSLYTMELEAAEKELMKLRGVGKKVADCALLFGFGRVDSFPIDRHIKRISENMYPDGLPEKFNGIEGIVQQYMFHLQRIGV